MDVLEVMVKKFLLWGVGLLMSLVVLCVGIVAFFYFGSNNYRLTGVPVLNYHQVNDKFITPLTMTTADFESQMKYLKDEGYHSISQEQFSAYMNGTGKLPEKPVLITFDDGYIDNYECAYPIMKKYDMRGTIFLICNFLDQPRYLTTAQVTEMAKDGMEFGSHTVSHRALTTLDESTVHMELTQSKKILEQKLGKPVPYLAYPEGKFNDMVKKETKACGYTEAFTVETGRDFPWDDQYELDRVPFFEGPGSFQHFRFRLIFSAFSAALWKTHAFVAHTEWCKHLAHYIPQP